MRAALLVLLAMVTAGGFLAQSPATPDEIWMCPMDPEVRGHAPGICPRCGMKLETGLPGAIEYHMTVVRTPSGLEFQVLDPWKGLPVNNFQEIHERLFHLFVIGPDLSFFRHDHPVALGGGKFAIAERFPTPGAYRIVGDFYPDAATPQLIAKTILVPGTPPPPPRLQRDYAAKKTENLEVDLTTDPPQPLAHSKTMLFFRLNPGDGLEKYLGVWGHAFFISQDQVDTIHTHPFLADVTAAGGPQIQFNVIFPRATMYRVWVQFQRNGVVNTAHFDIPVEQLR